MTLRIADHHTVPQINEEGEREREREREREKFCFAAVINARYFRLRRKVQISPGLISNRFSVYKTRAATRGSAMLFRRSVGRIKQRVIMYFTK